MKREQLISAALGREQPDLVLKNAKIINVFTGEILDGDIAVQDGYIAGIGSYQGKEEHDLGGRYAVPGFINAHLHVESSMVTPLVYAYEELRHGTTTLITDPHEIANVGGLEALEDILKAAEKCPVNYYVMLPSCVPATPFEHAGAVLSAADLLTLKNRAGVLGLGELMNTPGTLGLDSGVMAKIHAFSDTVIDGHSPMLAGKELNAYICAGVRTDHEAISYEEAAEKLRKGLAVLVREGSASKNLESIITGVVRNGIDTSRMAFCTDDKHLADIRREGTIRFNIQRAVKLGLPPVKAIQMATINAAAVYGLKDLGAIACGYKADIAVVDDLTDFHVHNVYKDGIQLCDLPPAEDMTYNPKLLSSVCLAPLHESDFNIPGQEAYPVIGIVEHQIVTRKIMMKHSDIINGLADGTVRKIAVAERHHATGCMACGYITGYGLKHGAIASTVAHDSHNLIIIGDNNADMLAAAEEIQRIGGGYTIVCDGSVKASLPLELGGLMSLQSADEFIPELDRIIRMAYDMGVNKNIDPFITMSFMALPVIPELRITDCGMFDVNAFCIME